MNRLAYSVIDLEGDDATAFANAHFSSDVRALQPGHWQWSSWLDARGRVRGLFLLVGNPDGTLRLLLRGGDAVKLIEHLRMFVLRSQVNIVAQPDMHAVDHANPIPMHSVQAQDGEMVIGFGDYAVRLTPHTPAADAGCEWQRLDIERGFAWLPQAASGAFLSPELSLRRVDATSLTKGCYPGQEIATRLHHRGGNKRHLCQVHGSRAIAPGSEVHLEDSMVGMVLQSVPDGDDHVGLAVLHDRALAMGARDTLRVCGRSSEPLRASRRFDD